MYGISSLSLSDLWNIAQFGISPAMVGNDGYCTVAIENFWTSSDLVLHCGLWLVVSSNTLVFCGEFWFFHAYSHPPFFSISHSDFFLHLPPPSPLSSPPSCREIITFSMRPTSRLWPSRRKTFEPSADGLAPSSDGTSRSQCSNSRLLSAAASTARCLVGVWRRTRLPSRPSNRTAGRRLENASIANWNCFRESCM